MKFIAKSKGKLWKYKDLQAAINQVRANGGGVVLKEYGHMDGINFGKYFLHLIIN